MPAKPGRRAAIACLALALALVARPGRGQLGTAELVADLVDEVPQALPWDDSQPAPVATLGGRVLFLADDGRHGRELWSTDGTTAGTRRITDLCPGPCSPTAASMAVVGDRLFLTADDGAGRAVFVTDGTAAGTHLVRRLPGVGGYGHGAALGDRYFFVVPDGTGDSRLWQSDGTPEGTVPFCSDCTIISHGLTVYDGALFYLQEEETHLHSLWRTDGAARRERVLPAPCETSCVAPTPLVIAGGRLFFSADDGQHGLEPWVLGSAWGAPQLLDGDPGSGSTVPIGPVAWRGAAYLNLHQPPGNRSWYRADGNGLSPVPALQPYGVEEATYGLFPAGDILYFVARIGNTEELWAIGPGVEGPRRILGNLLQASPLANASVGFGALRGRALFALRQVGEPKQRLWSSDGTTAGTVPIGDYEAAYGPTVTYSVGGGAFVALDGGNGMEPWVSDGTAAGTLPLGDLKARDGSDPNLLTMAGDSLFFRAGGDDVDWYGDLYRAGAADAGATRVDAAGQPEGLAAAGDRVVVAAYQSLRGVDGQTLEVVELPSPASPFRLTPWGSRVALGDFDDQSLWASDGTAAGTATAVPSTNFGSNYCPFTCHPGWPTYPQHLTPAGESLFFVGNPVGYDVVFRTDGTTTGTVAIPVPGDAPNHDLGGGLPLGAGAVFLGQTWAGAQSSHVLWSAGSTSVELAPLLASSEELRLLVSLGDRVLFARRRSAGDELWATDGTTAGTVVVTSLGLGARVTSGAGLSDVDGYPPVERSTAAGGRAFFAVVDEVRGEEPWVSDGTAAGTRPVADLRPGRDGSNPLGFTAHGYCAVFAASDGVSGHELWASSGEQTFLVADLAPGHDGSSPSEMTVAGEGLYFAGDDGVHGRELFVLPAATLATRCSTPPWPTPPAGGWLASEGLPGFRFKVRFGSGAATATGATAPCAGPTACVAGAVAGRTDLLLRALGPRPNGRLQITLAKLVPARAEIWLEHEASGHRRYYLLDATAGQHLGGLIDRTSFRGVLGPAASFGPAMDVASTTDLGSPDLGSATEAGGLRAEAALVAPPAPGWITTPAVPGFRFRVVITDGTGKARPGRGVPCLGGTLCVAGAVRDRAEVFLRFVGPRPNGRLRPAIARLTPGRVDVWVEQTATGVVRHYVLPAVAAGSENLDGILDRTGFAP
jgi:ELWxxDGT repeat protein